MKILDFDFYDKKRSRNIPVAIFKPIGEGKNYPAIIFSPGYQSQEQLRKEGLNYKVYNFLAEYFTSKGFVFISIQHDMLGDDGLETVDPEAIQDDARKHLYIRGKENILFVLESLKKEKPTIEFDNMIFAGHSNGGDIAKYFTNQHPEYVKSLILFDSRRAKLVPKNNLKVLMFEADDTMTDEKVIPEPYREDNSKRSNLDLVIVKPSGAMHRSYKDEFINEEVKNKIFISLDWFLNYY